MPKIVLFGATGYTGRLCAHALVKRGLAPLLAARNDKKLRALVSELGVELETRVATSDDVIGLRALLDEGDVLITTVGPFTRHGQSAVHAAIGKHAHYFDSTGEPSFVQRIFMVDHDHALGSGTRLLTAFGYDYVPGHLAAALALREAGERASRVDVGYFFTGTSDDSPAVSQGTEYSSRLAAIDPGMEWCGGQLTPRYNGLRVREFQVGGRSRAALTVCGSEHYALPREFPSLRNVNVYLGWFGRRSYLLSRGARVLAAVRSMPLISKVPEHLLRLAPESHGAGPSAETRAAVRSHVVAIAYDDNDRELSRVDVGGANAYDFTAEILAWGAAQTLAGSAFGHGARGPVEAFGLSALRAGCEQAGLQVLPAADVM